ncbi:O-succinylbenzoic acid--CoA ligase [Polaribacter aestuariivivens]|uniref:O-succinylbenzoic acid--CoA ligase n=1 Tax=Polaribacter aestuariivivens TaxID=2304626 RepID=A0A5S3N9D9_9FLAO|nr:AMP-binding protein [Polaribacter aestuariivivens]TMM31898.1 O-succinylbenzoic acid--CoA ligase [Polaribacter aestuariivivens]
MKQNKFHKEFQLNNTSFSTVDELLSFTKNKYDDVYQFLKEWFSIENEIVVQTSGSTGIPKSILLQKSKMLQSALATGLFFHLKPNTTALLCLPIKYIAGKMMLVRALSLGWHLDVVAPNSNPLLNIQKTYDFSAMIPLQVQNSIDKLHNIKKLIVGGGVVSNQLQEKLQSVSTEVFATYGMTETITHIAVKKINQFSGLSENEKQSFYKVLPNITIYKDERNCLVIKAPKITDDVIFTNDVVNLISDIQFEWLGRFDNVINSGGVKLHPEKIEEKLAKIISKRFFVAGVSDQKLGKKLILVIEGNEIFNYKKENLIPILKNTKTLHKFEIPKEVYFVNTFIETATGKIQREKTLKLAIN